MGNIVLARGSSQVIVLGGLYNIIGDPLKKNNILSSSTSFNDSDRFNKYKCISQLNNSTFDQTVDPNDPDYEIGGMGSMNAVSTTAETTDSAIRNTRVLVFNSESASSGNDLKQRVNWEINIRRVRSAIYRATVQGDSYDGINPWRVNRLVQVIDNFAGINATLLIRSVNFELSLDGGTRTTLELVVADGYSPSPEQTPQKKKANDLGGIYESDTPGGTVGTPNAQNNQGN
jgi:prophage tail gpP-like protein